MHTFLRYPLRNAAIWFSVPAQEALREQYIWLSDASDSIRCPLHDPRITLRYREGPITISYQPKAIDGNGSLTSIPIRYLGSLSFDQHSAEGVFLEHQACRGTHGLWPAL